MSHYTGIQTKLVTSLAYKLCKSLKWLTHYVSHEIGIHTRRVTTLAYKLSQSLLFIPHLYCAIFILDMCVQRRFTFLPWSLGHKSSVNILAQYAATAHWLISLTGTHLYTWVERSRCGINFLLKEISVVRAGFEPGTSRSLSQRPTIRPLLPLTTVAHTLCN